MRFSVFICRLSRVTWPCLAAGLLLASAAGAEVRLIEAVGAVPVYRDQRGAIAPRDAAIRRALREAVERVAEEFLAEAPFRDASQTGARGEAPPSVLGDGGEEAGGPPLAEVLGEKMVPYTSRFRVVEDRGERPALFAEDPGVISEYVVIVEVHVDVERVRKRLVQKGLIPEGLEIEALQTVYLEVEGLSAYPAYASLRELLLGDEIGATSVVAVEMRHGRSVLEIQAGLGAAELLEKLLTLAPPEMKLVPLHAAPERAHVAIEWSGPVTPPRAAGD